MDPATFLHARMMKKNGSSHFASFIILTLILTLTLTGIRQNVRTPKKPETTQKILSQNLPFTIIISVYNTQGVQ